MEICLKLYAGETETGVNLIRAFWFAHNQVQVSEEDARKNLTDWTAPDHRFYLILVDGTPAGFLHLGSRGGACDWLEDLFVLSQFQRRGIGTKAIKLAEQIVEEYSESLYIEAAARNEAAIRLYHRLGYDCLNTITIRKDFWPDDFSCLKPQKLFDLDFEVRKRT